MKALLTLFVVLLTISANASGTSHKVRKVKTGTYDRIMVSGDFTVKLVPGKEGEIFIEGDRDDVRYLEVMTEGNILRIYPQKDYKTWCGDMTSLMVVVPFESLEEIVMAGPGKIVSEETIKATRFKTQLSGSGSIALELSTTETEVFLSGSGQVKLSGSTGKFISNVTGEGQLQAYAFQSATTDAVIIGSGKSEVSSSETLNAQVAGSGRIQYIGNPKNEQKTIIGTGFIAARQ